MRPAPPPVPTVHPFNARFLPALTLDRKRRPGRRNPTKTGRAEAQYRKALRSVAEHVGALITGMQEKNLTMVPSWTHLLGAYADALVPWAIRVSQRMLDEVNGRDLDSWRSLGEAISRQLHRDITRSPVGERMDDLLREQVTLIKSIPLEAAQRVQELTLKGLEDSTRSAEYVAEIMRSGEVAKSRAVLIARTEVARTASVLNQARAESAGSTHFTWKTSEDGAVRPDHKILANRVFAWDDPPIADRRTGERALPGRLYNCRCFTPDTRVSLQNGVRRLWRAPFRGDIHELNIAGQRLECTPNHPVLTDAGWVAARLLNSGHHVVQSFVEPLGAVEDDKDDDSVTFAELFEAFPFAGENAPAAVADFYGDVPDGYVDCVAIEELLADYGVPPLLQGVSDLPFADADGRVRRAVLGGAGHIREALLSGKRDARSAPALRHGGHAGKVSLARIARRNRKLSQSLRYDPAVDPVLLRKRQNARAGRVLLGDAGRGDVLAPVALPDRRPPGDGDAGSAQVLAEVAIANAKLGRRIFEHDARLYKFLPFRDQVVRKNAPSGHVFTMQTYTGWYGVTPLNIIAKNCYAEAIISDDD